MTYTVSESSSQTGTDLSQRYVVIKYGGNALDNTADLTFFAYGVAQLLDHGYRPVIVHGGGPHISHLLGELGIPSNFVHGYRISTPAVVEIATMVLAGQVAPLLITALSKQGLIAASLSGQDAQLYTVHKYCPVFDGQELDIGQVGEITSVNIAVIDQLLTLGIIPVISSIGPDDQGVLYNVNADSAAGAIAGALSAEALIVLTNVAGIFRNWPDQNSLIGTITVNELAEILPAVDSGMVPKIRGCLHALEHGAHKAHIVHAHIVRDYVSIIESECPLGTVILP